MDTLNHNTNIQRETTILLATSTTDKTIHYLPDNCLELIFTHVNLYDDFNSLKLVSRRWNQISNGSLRRMKRFFYKCVDFSWYYT
jgi:hypothetical protein